MEQKVRVVVLVVVSIFFLAGCAGGPERYNTQWGTGIGAVLGGVAGQIVGGNSKSTLIGAGIGAGTGLLVGNAMDQYKSAQREAMNSGKAVTYYDNQGYAVQAVPGPSNPQTRCQKVTKRIWEKGVLVSETTEEVCRGKMTTNDY